MNWFIKKHKNVLGIDISTVAVKLIELSKSGSYYKVESYAITPFQPSSGESTLTNSNVITDALKTAIYSSKTTLKTANIAVSGSAVITKIISIPCSLTDSEMEEQIMIEADQYIPYSLDEVNFDFEVQGVNKNNPEIVDVLLVISRREIVNYRVDALTKVGLKASIVDVDTFAMENAFPLLPNYLPHSNDSLTVAIADIGATLSTLTILHNGRVIYTRDQDFGGQQLTEAIQDRYGLSYEKAGLAKIQGGLPDNYKIDILEPFKDAMVQQIQRSLQLFISSKMNRNIDYIVLAGGCASIKSADTLIAHHIGLPIHIANPFINMNLSHKVAPGDLYAVAPAMMIACGLAARGFD